MVAPVRWRLGVALFIKTQQPLCCFLSKISTTNAGTWTSFVAASGFNPLPKRTRIGIAREPHRSQSCSPGDQPVMPARPGGLRAAAAHGSCSFWVAYTPPKSRRRLRKPFFLRVSRKPCHRTAISGFRQYIVARSQISQVFVLQASSPICDLLAACPMARKTPRAPAPSRHSQADFTGTPSETGDVTRVVPWVIGAERPHSWGVWTCTRARYPLPAPPSRGMRV